MIELENLPLKGLKVARLKPFKDERGAFYRLFCSEIFKDVLDGDSILQINHSITKIKGTIRGMHFQHPPFSETKIIKCLKGSIFDVLVDIRKGSDTFLHWQGIELNEDNDKMVVIPKGFAHGFQSLSSDVELLYLHTKPYTPEFEGGIKYNDPKLNIQWVYPPLNVSDRDTKFEPLDSNFKGI
jgi:dTDP-4-dehydrorhamnose 3,5-epimerase